MPAPPAQPPTSSASPLALHVVTQPGLEAITAAELRDLGIRPTRDEPGGLSFTGSARDLARANLHLRTASRILLRGAEFPARALGELERKAGQLPWDRWLPADLPVTFRVTSKKSRLYHQKAIAERLARAAGVAGRTSGPATSEVEDDAPAMAEPGQLVIVRVLRDVCHISLDSSGEDLHRRGYRLAGAKAPLRETLAAALLLASQWDPATPLVDPFAGSGTIGIEAARLARRIPPGLARNFAFRHWPGWEARVWDQVLTEARDRILRGAAAPIVVSDRDAGAVRAIEQNAERAGVAADLTCRRAAISDLAPPPGPGALVSNPPWGVRIGDQRALRDLYARLGQLLQERCGGWRATLLLPQAPLERATGLGWETIAHTGHGGVAVRMVRWPPA
jgi:putative N6-adenine-specific DNA methylase